MSKQAVNPYLPSWEYVPDAEPYVFGDRVYVYGSHDRFNGHHYCVNDYVCWSAPVDDLADWRYEGVIYKRTDDPKNADGEMCLFAPDVTQGKDGRYYLYYVLDKLQVVSVAVCDTPAGKYRFYGYVKRENGELLGEGAHDSYHFDPAVLLEEDTLYLYTGFCWPDNKAAKGCMVTVLKDDMLTVVEEPSVVIPSKLYSQGTGFEGYEYYEAPSIRKIDGMYYLVYSSVQFHELCYAVSQSPVDGFIFKGVIVSNNDIHIDSYKPATKPMFYGSNNHGGMVEVNDQWYIFYHRHTNGTNFSRQGCIERLTLEADGTIKQVEMTSNGANEGPLKGQGEYPAYIACNLTCTTEEPYTGAPYEWMDSRFPKITQDGSDGEQVPAYIVNMKDGTMAGFKYFECQTISRVGVKTRIGNNGGYFEVRLKWDEEPIGMIPIRQTNEWTWHFNEILIPVGTHALYFTYRGYSSISLQAFHLD